MIRHLKKIAAIAGLSLFSLSIVPALAYSVGGGGAAPPAVYTSASPTLTSGATTQLHTDVNGKLQVAPVSAATTLPIHEQGTVPISTSTTLPTHEQGTVPISTSTTLPTHEQGTVPITTSTALPVNIQNYQAAQGVIPVPAASPFNINCVSGCTSSGTATTTYNSSLTSQTSGTSGIGLQSDQYGQLRVAPFTLSLASPLPVQQGYVPVPVTGTITTNGGAVSTALNGASGVTIYITGTFVGTLEFRYSDIGTSPYGSGNQVYPQGGNSNTSTTGYNATAIIGHPYFQVIATAWTSGTANVSLSPLWSSAGQLTSHNGNSAPIYFPNNGNGTNAGLSTIGQTEAWDGTQWKFIRSDPGVGVQMVTTGGTSTQYITGGTAGGTIVDYNPGRLVQIVSTSTTTQANPFECSNSIASLAGGNPLWVGILQPGVPVKLDMYASVGIFCQSTSGALNAGFGVNVQYQ